MIGSITYYGFTDGESTNWRELITHPRCKGFEKD